MGMMSRLKESSASLLKMEDALSVQRASVLNLDANPSEFRSIAEQYALREVEYRKELDTFWNLLQRPSSEDIVDDAHSMISSAETVSQGDESSSADSLALRVPKRDPILTVPVLRGANQNARDLSAIKRRFGVSPSMNAPVQIETVPFRSTLTLRGNGYGVCSESIWSDDHFQCIQKEEVMSNESVRSVNTAESTISAETPNEDIFVNESEQCTPKRKRKRTRRRRRRKE